MFLPQRRGGLPQVGGGSDPSHQEVIRLAQEWRVTMWDEAKEAESAMGTPQAFIPIEESDVSFFC